MATTKAKKASRKTNEKQAAPETCDRRTVASKEFRQRFSDEMDAVEHRGERVIITRNGKAAVAVVPAIDLARLEAIEDAEDLRAARKALAEIDSGKVRTVPLADLRKRIG